MDMRTKSAVAAVAALASGLAALGTGAASAHDIGSGVDHATKLTLATQYQAQQRPSWSGPAATRIALSALGNAPTQAALAKQLGTTTEGTSDVSPVTRALRSDDAGDYRAIHVTSPMTASGTSLLWSRIEDSVALRHAVVAEIRIRRGSAATPPGYRLTSSYLDTFVTIVGYDEGADHSEDGHFVRGDHVKRVLVDDPASSSKSYWMTYADLVQLMPAGGYSYYD